MFYIFLFFISGLLFGIFLRRYPNIKIIGKLVTTTIIALLFLLGKSVGKNEAIMHNLTTIGLKAFVITMAAITGSVLMSMIVYKYFFSNKNEGDNKAIEVEEPVNELANNINLQ